MLKRTLICALVIFMLAGCSRSMGSLATTVPPTATNIVIITQMPAIMPSLPAATPTSSASPTPFITFTVNSSVDNLKLRTNPGMLFEALLMVQAADDLTVIGAAPGYEWTNVKTPDGTIGWVFTKLLTSKVDLTRVPIKQPENVLLITGQVKDANGLPIQGVGFDINQTVETVLSSNTAVTDASGTFYSFLPASSTGVWEVNYSSMDCNSSVWSDNTCTTYKPGYTGAVDPATVSVSLPQEGNPVLFNFR